MLGQFADLLQIDATTGTTQATVNNQSYGADHLAISPDRTALFTGDNGISPARLRKFDIGSATPSPGQTTEVGYNGESVVMKHDGQYVCFVNGAEIYGYRISVFDPHDLNVVYGSFDTGAYPRGITFSPDDTVAYCLSGQTAVQLFSTRRFVFLGSVDAVESDANDITTDGSGQELFVAEASAIRVYDVSGKTAPSAMGMVGVALTYQPMFDFSATSYSAADLPDGLSINSATGLIAGTPTQSGAFVPLITASDGTHTASKEVSLSIFPNSRAKNISTRADVGTGDNVLIAGFIIEGSGNKNVVVRAIGPSLQVNGQPIPGRMNDPALELHDGTGTRIGYNDNWRNDADAGQLAATGLAPTNDLEAALYRTLSPGAYTAIIRGAQDSTGIALAEVYEPGAGELARFGNISTRSLVGTEANVMIGGFIIAGPDAAQMLVRAVGPSLAAQGLAGSLADPTLDLYNGQGTRIATNDDWRDDQEAEIRATGIAPLSEREPAILSLLSPGNYTAIVAGKENMTGLALVEAYDLP